MGEEGGDWVKLGLGLEPVSCDVNLVFSPVDEICCHHLLFTSVLREVVHEAQADVALQGVAVGTAGGLAHVLPISVDGLPPPRPEVQVCVMIIQDEHSEAFIHPILLLLQQSISANEIHPLGKKGNTETASTLWPTARWEGSWCHYSEHSALPPHPCRLWGNLFLTLRILTFTM